MRRIKKKLAYLLIVLMSIGVFSNIENVSAKTMKKKGIYSITNDKISVNFFSKKIIIKGKMKYGKKFKTFQKYKNIGKGKKIFRINSKTKYYVSLPGGDDRISRKEAKYRAKTISDCPGVAYLYIYVKKGKIFKVLFTVC